MTIIIIIGIQKNTKMITKFHAVSFLFWFGLQSFLIFVNEIGEKGNVKKKTEEWKEIKIGIFSFFFVSTHLQTDTYSFLLHFVPFLSFQIVFRYKIILYSDGFNFIDNDNVFFPFLRILKKNEGEMKNSRSLLWHGSDIVRYVNLFYFCTKTATYLLTICLGSLVFSNILTVFCIKVKSKFVFLDIG